MDGVADFIDVAGPDALLIIGQSLARRMFGPEQIGNQGVHSGRRKETGRVVFGNQRRAFDFRMAPALEKFDVSATDFRCFHDLPVCFPE